MKKLFLKKLSILVLVVFGCSLVSSAQTSVYSYTGSITNYTVPAGMTLIRISAAGAQGGSSSAGSGGLGAIMTGTFTVTPGQVLKVLVGGSGQNASNTGGGGGGSFVWDNASSSLLIAAGGGGGAGLSGTTNSGVDAVTTANGTQGRAGVGGGGVGGNGGTAPSHTYYAGGGAGWLSNGANGNYNCGGVVSQGGTRPLLGGAGGAYSGSAGSNGSGGFGGGGGSQGRCGAVGGGGGGGYSGGGAGSDAGSGAFFAGGGGGSFSAGSATSSSVSNTGNGQVTVTTLCFVPTGGTITGATVACGAGANFPLTTTGASPGGVWSSSNLAVGSISNTGVVTSVSPGSTVISYTATSCSVSASSTYTITVNPLPAPISGTSTLCANTSTTLTNTLSPGGVWSSSNTFQATIGSTSGVLTGVSAGNPTITYTLPTTCYAVRTTTVNAAPDVITGTPAVCQSSTTTLFNTTTGGTWSSAGVGVASVVSGTGVVTGVTPGTTTISYTLTSTGCAATSTVRVNALPTPFSLIATGPTSYCTGGTGVRVLLSGSQIGVNYQLFNNSTTMGGLSAGTAGAIDYGMLTPAGSYSVVATNASTGCTRSMTGGVNVAINPLPVVYNVGGGGSMCADGTGLDITLDNSQTGISYQVYQNGTTPYGSATFGTGGAITWPAIMDPGVYTVLAYNISTGCSNNMAGSATITINALPNVQNVTVANSGHYCSGGIGVNVGLDNSVPGISYQLWNGVPLVGTTVGSPRTGSSSALDFGPIVPSGTYFVRATNVATGCAIDMANSVDVTPDPLPNPYVVSSGGSRCFGAAGVNINVSPSDFGIDYQLYMGTTPIGLRVSGNGGLVDMDSHFADGVYTVVGIDQLTGCRNNMTGSARIIVNPLPIIETVTGDGNYCLGGAGSHVRMSPSQTGIEYQVMYMGAPSMTPMIGTGGALDFGARFDTGVYTIIATNTFTTCQSEMAGNATILVNPLPEAHTVTISGDGSYCAGSGGVHVGLNYSNLGINYQLYRGTTLIGGVTAGTNTPYDFGLQTIAGNYHVEATNSATGCANTMSNTVDVVVNPLPTAYSVTGSGSYCAGGAGLRVGVAGSQVGVSYQLIRNGSVYVGGPLAGSGVSLDFGAQTAPGVYTVIATNNATNCTKQMTGNATIAINALPSVYNVTGGGQYCAGGSGVNINISGTNTGINYQLYNGSTPVGALVNGTGSAISFGLQTAAGTYKVMAINATNTCSSLMSDSGIISVNPLPALQLVTGGGNYCTGGTGVHIGLMGSVTGISYQLWNGSARVGSLVPGNTGSDIDFGVQTIGGSYTVTAINPITSCGNTMVGSATITPVSLPTAYTVTGGGSFCDGGAGMHVRLTGSTSGIKYQLYNGINPVGTPVTGTGASIDFGSKTDAGVYTVIATNPVTSCVNNMTASATINVNALPVAYTVTGGGSYCAGGAGVNISLLASGLGNNYQLYNGTTAVGLPIGGTGASLNFGLNTAAGNYTIVATNTTTGCGNTMTGSANIAITPLVTPAVTVASDMGALVCPGVVTHYTATPVNGGSTPVYQWMVNGVYMGGSNTFSYVPANGDTVAATMTTSATCPSTPSASSAMVMSLRSYVLPEADITASTGTTICPGTNVTTCHT